MPSQKAIPEDCLQFAETLRSALDRAQLHDTAAIGRLVASLQEDPQREDLPYHPVVVQAWLEGRCIPTPSAFLAMQDMLADVIDDRFESSYDAAADAAALQNAQASEIGLLFRHRLRMNKYKIEDFAAAMKDKGETNAKGQALSKPAFANWMSGFSPIPHDRVPAIDQLLVARDEPSYDLVALDQLAHTTPAQYLTKAATTDDIHRALRYMRKSMRMGSEALASAISEQLPSGHAITSVGLRNWELLSSNPYSHLPRRATLPGTDLITVYGEVLTKHGHGAWFDANEQHLRGLLQQGISKRTRTYRIDYAIKESTATESLAR